MLPTGSDIVIPPDIGISKDEFDEHLDDWLIYRALEKRHLPFAGGYKQQPKRMMDAIIKIDSLYEMMVAQQQRQK